MGFQFFNGFIFYPQKQSASKIRISFINSTFEEIKKGIGIMKNILNNCEGVSNK